MAWSLAAIEFVAWSVLQEDGSGEEVAEKALEEACRANPFVAWNIAHREIFDQVRRGCRGQDIAGWFRYSALHPKQVHKAGRSRWWRFVLVSLLLWTRGMELAWCQTVRV